MSSAPISTGLQQQKSFIGMIHESAQSIGLDKLVHQYVVIQNNQTLLKPDRSKATPLILLEKYVMQGLVTLQKDKSIDDEEVDAVLTNVKKIKTAYINSGQKVKMVTSTLCKVAQFLDTHDQIRASQVCHFFKADIEEEMKAQIKSAMIGADYWRTHQVEVGKEPRLPVDWFEKLKGPFTINQHSRMIDKNMVVMISKTMNGKPTTIRNCITIMEKIMNRHRSDSEKPFKVYIPDQVLAEYGDVEIIEPFWLLMTTDVLSGTSLKSKSLAITTHDNGYDEPKMLPSMIAIFIHYLKTGVTQYGNMHTYCKETLKEWGEFGGRTFVGGISRHTFTVSFDYANYCAGNCYFVDLAGQQKFQ